MIIGITGKSGSGKSYASEILAKSLNLKHIDIDKISHEVLSYPETVNFLKTEFGDLVFDNDVLNRKTLGKIVFNDNIKLEKLNNFCQSLIENKLDGIIQENKNIILDYALLPLLKNFNDCDVKILLTADFETRLRRVQTRENITKEYFLSRDNSVLNYDKKMFDYVLENANIKDIETLATKLKEELWSEKQQS